MKLIKTTKKEGARNRVMNIIPFMREKNLDEIENKLNNTFNLIEEYDNATERIKAMLLKDNNDYLERSSKEIEKWKVAKADYSVIGDFIKEVRKYIAELRKRFDGLKIVKRIDDNKLLKHIMWYKEENVYIGKFYGNITISVEDPTRWKLFYPGFYDHLKKHAKTIKDDFGDELTFKEMMRGKKEYGELAEKWKELFEKIIIPRLESKRYIEYLVTRVQKALLSIIEHVKKENEESVTKKISFYDAEVNRLKVVLMNLIVEIDEKHTKSVSKAEELIPVSERSNKYDNWIAKALEHLTSKDMEDYLINKMGYFPKGYTEKILEVQNAKLDVIKEEIKVSKKVVKGKKKAYSIYKEALRIAEILLEDQKKLYRKIHKLAEKKGIRIITRERVVPLAKKEEGVALAA